MNSRIAIIGSGFLSNIVYQLLSHYMENLNIEVIGSQQNNWNINLSKNLNGKYNVIIDLNSNYYKHFEEEHLEDNSLLVIAAKKDKKIPLDFEQFLWKNITINCPSPRNDLDFRAYMELSKDYVEQNIINVDFAWTKCYNRNTEWKQAFEDGNNRPENYVRGYLDWR